MHRSIQCSAVQCSAVQCALPAQAPAAAQYSCREELLLLLALQPLSSSSSPMEDERRRDNPRTVSDSGQRTGAVLAWQVVLERGVSCARVDSEE